MSDLALITQQLPAFATEKLNSGLNAMAVAANPRISGEGGVFRVLAGEQQFGGTYRELDVIIIGAMPDARAVSRVWYAGQFVKGENAAPTCSSLLGDVPDAHVEHKAAASCDVCPNNVDGSGQGGRGRACGYTKTFGSYFAWHSRRSF